MALVTLHLWAARTGLQVALAPLDGTTPGDQGCAACAPLLSGAQWAYVWGLAALEAYASGAHAHMPWGPALPFLPLMLTSAYAAVGVTMVWGAMAVGYMRECTVFQ